MISRTKTRHVDSEAPAKVEEEIAERPAPPQKIVYEAQLPWRHHGLATGAHVVFVYEMAQ
jgi:hypothetical protein